MDASLLKLLEAFALAAVIFFAYDRFVNRSNCELVELVRNNTKAMTALTSLMEQVSKRLEEHDDRVEATIRDSEARVQATLTHSKDAPHEPPKA